MLVAYPSLKFVKLYNLGENTLRKCGKLHGGECMMGTNACFSCGKLGHTVKDCPIRRSQEQGKERVQSNGPSEEAPRRQRFFALMSRGAEEGSSG